uniref:Craniofacial development protein 2-like n=1 Tax=Nicotiana sylvestris TaxID=4096 RepID=A0A1U7UX57_NICSY|nr:PREDICTED: craniofacial development protein 2-like [Nicotiana sylvestris]
MCSQLQARLDEEIKRRFREGLDEIVCNIPPTEKLFIGGDFNGHIGSAVGGYSEEHGGFGFGERNGGDTSLLDFAKAFEMVIANSSFSKREEHLVTFQSSVVAKTQIDYFLLRREDRRLCQDCKVIPGNAEPAETGAIPPAHFWLQIQVPFTIPNTSESSSDLETSRDVQYTLVELVT